MGNLTRSGSLLAADPGSVTLIYMSLLLFLIVFQLQLIDNVDERLDQEAAVRLGRLRESRTSSPPSPEHVLWSSVLPYSQTLQVGAWHRMTRDQSHLLHHLLKYLMRYFTA